MKIKITQKDIENSKIQFTDSGYIIDELAYSVGQLTSDEVQENNIEYSPKVPYMFNFEADLFDNTKTALQYIAINTTLEAGAEMGANITEQKKSGLQAGAFMALNYPEQWQKLLEAYTENLKENPHESISEAYNKALEKEQNEFYSDLQHEWLHGDRSWCGVIEEVSKYYTESRDGHFDSVTATYTFEVDDNTIADYKERGYNKNQIKNALLDSIYGKGEARRNKQRAESEKRKIERENLAQYKADQKAKAEAERKLKLLAMTIK